MHHCPRCGTISAATLCPVCAQQAPRPLPVVRTRTQPTRPSRPSGPATQPVRDATTSPTTAGGSDTNVIRPLRLPTASEPVRRTPASGDGTERVVSTPVGSMGTRGIDEYVRMLLGPLVLIAILTNGAIMGALIFFLVMFVLLTWVLNRIGLGGVMRIFSLVGWMRLFIPSRGGPQPVPPTLAFRTDGPRGIREVRLRGYDTGIQLGDEVEVHGLPVNGTIQATSVFNRTTRSRLGRVGLGSAVAIALLDLWLLQIIFTQVHGR